MPETHAVGPASVAYLSIWGRVRRLNLTTGVTHGGAGAESGGAAKEDGGGGHFCCPFSVGCVMSTERAAGMALRYKRFFLKVLKEPFRASFVTNPNRHSVEPDLTVSCHVLAPN